MREETGEMLPQARRTPCPLELRQDGQNSLLDLSGDHRPTAHVELGLVASKEVKKQF